MTQEVLGKGEFEVTWFREKSLFSLQPEWTFTSISVAKETLYAIKQDGTVYAATFQFEAGKIKDHKWETLPTSLENSIDACPSNYALAGQNDVTL